MSRNIEFAKEQLLTSYRKIAIASWDHPRDPQVYASFDFPMEKVEEFLERHPSSTAATLTHYVAKILAHTYQRYPQFNHVLRRGRLHQRKDVDAFVTTLVKNSDGMDLSGFVIRDVNALTLEEVAEQSAEGAKRLRSGNDPMMNSVKGVVKILPHWFLRIVMRGQDFCQNTLNMDLTWLGRPRDPVGSFILTNIGALGLESAYIPLTPFPRCPLLVGVGKPYEKPVVRDGEVVPGKVVTVTFTFDHRHADGAHGARVLRRFEKIFVNPEGFPQVFGSE